MPLALCVAAAFVPAAAVSMDVAPAVPAQEVGEPDTLIEAVVACDVELDAVGNEPRPTVPRPVVPRLPAPRPTTPRPPVSNVEFAVAVGLPGSNEGSDEEELALDFDAVVELREFITPELLIELHGTGVLVAPKAAGRPEAVEPVEGLIPPPSKVGNAAVPGFPVEQGAGLTVPE